MTRSKKEAPVSDFDSADIEIIMGQDHCYWIYSNKKDMYIETSISWHRHTEEEMLQLAVTFGDELWRNAWDKYEDVDI